MYYLFSSFSSHYYSYALELIAQNRYTSYYICKSKPISFSKHVFKFHSILLTYPKSTQNISVTTFNVSFVLLQDSRLSSKLMFRAKSDSEIVDFSNNFQLLQFQFDRWLYKTVSGGQLLNKSQNYTALFTFFILTNALTNILL